jgi:FkbM family methyltransferase
MNQIIFKSRKKYSLIDMLSFFRKKNVRDYLRKLNRQHLKQKKRQLVVFSFDHIALDIQLNSIYEIKELTTLFQWLKPLHSKFSQSAAIDAEANIGNHSLFFSDFFKEVYSFEPNPRTFKVLSINADLVENIVVNNFGLSEKKDTLSLHVNPKNIGGAAIDSKKTDNQVEKFTIQVNKLDDCDLPDAPISFIKIDVEGHEKLMLLGSELTIKKHQPIIVFEQLANEINNGSSECIELLKKYGYSKFAYIKTGSVVSKKIPKFFRIAASEILKLCGCEYSTVVLTDNFEKQNYTFIVAIPNWCEKDNKLNSEMLKN